MALARGGLRLCRLLQLPFAAINSKVCVVECGALVKLPYPASV